MGDVELHLLIADRWKADGGLMFGVVPKVLWEKHKPADGNNMIDCACVCLIARLNGRVIVCETGIGNKLSEKRAQQVMLREPESLLHHLQRLGIRPEEVDLVVTTHLHWDHAGGLTRRNAEGEVELTFKRARHFIQRSEWDFALQPDVRSRPSYITDDFTPLADGNDMVEFLDGDAEVLPGVHLRHVGGHTPGSQVLVLQSGEFACAVTGDLVCQTPNLRVPWNMAADIEPLRVLQQKAKLFEEAERHRWLLVLSHEVDQPAGYLEEGGRWRPEPRLL
ncbi:MAG: MBL fold metallo-hydrolase [Chloroflexi bacterium]|nr:MAG: MBL fold metallo-hydrolase [Chloroflexota bacterium]